MRDTVQHFCEKHLDKIRSYMASLSVKLPLPVKCTIEERKGRKHAKLHFGCQGRSAEFCLYKTTFYTMKTRNPRTWIHLMFLALQVLGIFVLFVKIILYSVGSFTAGPINISHQHSRVFRECPEALLGNSQERKPHLCHARHRCFSSCKGSSVVKVYK